MIKHILIVDDDSDDRELFREALNAVDPTIAYEFTEDAEEALNKLKEHDGVLPDIIFLDINLPGISGWECLTQIKNSNSLHHIPVFMYSTSGHHRDRDLAIDLGAVCLITKPMTYRGLKAMLAAVVAYAQAGKLASFANEIGRIQPGN